MGDDCGGGHTGNSRIGGTGRLITTYQLFDSMADGIRTRDLRIGKATFHRQHFTGWSFLGLSRVTVVNRLG